MVEMDRANGVWEERAERAGIASGRTQVWRRAAENNREDIV
jgi:hypothetical protein